LVFRMHGTGVLANERAMNLVLTNFIQSDVASPTSSKRTDLPLQSAALGPSSFASSLHSAGPAASEKLQSEPATVAARGKPAEKKTDDLKIPAPGQVTPAVGPVVIGDAKPSAVIVVNPEAMPPALQNIMASISAAGPIPPQVASSRSDTTIGSATGADFAKPGAAAASGEQVGKDAPTLSPGPQFDSRLSAAALGTGGQTPIGEPHSAAYESEASHASASKDTLAPTVARQEFAATLPSNPAVSEVPPQNPSGSAAQFPGSAGSGDPQVGPATPAQSMMPLRAMDLMSGGTPSAAPGANPSISDSKPQSGNGLNHQSLDALPSSSVGSIMSFSPDSSKPISLPVATATTAKETMHAADAHAKETPAVRVSSSQEHVPSKPSEPFANPSNANAQPASTAAVPASPAGQARGGDQPGNVAPTANVLAQVPTAANQDSGGRSAVAPAAERQSPSGSPPNPLPAIGTVEVARLVAGVAQSEMHIGLRTQAFGNVEVHTVVRDSQVGLTVGSERGDLRTLLATELSGLQTTFRQQDLRFDNIRFLETSAGTTAGFSGGTDSQGRSSAPQHSSATGLFSIHSPPEEPVELDIGAGLRARLNVHA
jgi:hypothetical protein